jgi:hypothetical protein
MKEIGSPWRFNSKKHRLQEEDEDGNFIAKFKRVKREESFEEATEATEMEKHPVFDEKPEDPMIEASLVSQVEVMGLSGPKKEDPVKVCKFDSLFTLFLTFLLQSDDNNNKFTEISFKTPSGSVFSVPSSNDLEADIVKVKTKVKELEQIELEDQKIVIENGLWIVGIRAKIKISIKQMNGETFSIEIAPCWTVGKMKSLIEQLTAIDSNNQRIVFAGKLLLNNQTLEKSEIIDGSILYLVMNCCYCIFCQAKRARIHNQNQ